jgi:hypothetical protein
VLQALLNDLLLHESALAECLEESLNRARDRHDRTFLAPWDATGDVDAPAPIGAGGEVRGGRTDLF